METKKGDCFADYTSGMNLRPWQLEPSSYLNGYLSLSHSIAIMIGIPLNIAVAAIIIGSGRLRKARNFSCLGICFSSIFLLVSHFFESLAAHWPSTETITICSWFTGHPYQTILLNLFISLLERYLCLKRPCWHKRWVARHCWIIPAVQFGLSALLFCLTVARQFLSDCYQLQYWTLSLPDVKILSSLILATYFTSLIGMATLYSTCSRKYPPAAIISSRQGRANSQQVPSSSSVRGVEEGQVIPSMDSEDSGKIPFVLIEGERVSQLDVDAARALTLSGVFILSSYFPMLVGLVYLFQCLDGLFDGLNDGSHCDSMAQMIYYERELISIPCFLIIPVYLVISSPDFKFFLRNKTRLIFLQFFSTQSQTSMTQHSNQPELESSSAL